MSYKKLEKLQTNTHLSYLNEIKGIITLKLNRCKKMEENMENKPDYFHHIEHRKFQSSSKITLWLSLVITMIFTVVEFVGGIVSNSLALLSDSFHMLSDVLALGLSMVAIYFSSKPPTKNYTYGFLRLEIIVAFLNGLALIVISLGIMYEGIMRIIHPRPVESGIMILIAFIGLIANIVLTIILMISLKKRIILIFKVHYGISLVIY